MGRWRRGKGGWILNRRAKRRGTRWAGKEGDAVRRVEELLVGNGVEKRGDRWSGFY